VAEEAAGGGDESEGDEEGGSEADGEADNSS